MTEHNAPLAWLEGVADMLEQQPVHPRPHQLDVIGSLEDFDHLIEALRDQSPTPIPDSTPNLAFGIPIVHRKTDYLPAGMLITTAVYLEETK